MRERTVEKALVRKGKQRGVKFIKFKSPSQNSLPDRIAFLPGPYTVLIECKRPDEPPRLAQENRLQEFIDKGYQVYVLDRVEDIDAILDTITMMSNMILNKEHGHKTKYKRVYKKK